MNYRTEIEPIDSVLIDGRELVNLPELTQTEKDVINPLVPPTSGIRMEIYEFREKENLLYMTARAQYMFLRVYKAVSFITKEELGKENPSVLIVSDDRPSASHLIQYCVRIFAQDGYKIYFQQPYDEKAIKDAEGNKYYSRMGTPHASASVTLCDDIDAVVELTASHNAMKWNGIKFYIGLSIPISGKVMQRVSEKALELTKIELKDSVTPIPFNPDKINNDYILELVKSLIDISSLKGRKIVLWPFLGHAPELQDLLTRAGADLVLIDEDVEPPNPTSSFDRGKVEAVLTKEDSNLAILLDADRDRIVFLVKNLVSGQFDTFSPNELYTAMHNILAQDFNLPAINVRTIPSDPRGDSSAQMNFITGVGFKHLGMIIYGALGKPIEEQKFQTGILYSKAQGKYEKILAPEDIPKLIEQRFGCDPGQQKRLMMVLWEESGGHTVNVLKLSRKTDNSPIIIESVFPPIGDKYPAVAILILSVLIESGYNLTQKIDQSIIGTRTTIDANDEQKINIVQYFAKLKGQLYIVNGHKYTVNVFEQVNGEIKIIHLTDKITDMYLRPSGTGPNVRIYVYGPKEIAETQLNEVRSKLNRTFST